MDFLFVNLLVNVLFFIFFFTKYGLKNISTFLAILYMLTSISSYFYSKNPLFFYSYSNQPIELDSLVFFNTINFFLIFPFRKYSISKIHNIRHINFNVIRKLLLFFIIANILFFILDGKSILTGLFSNNLKELRDNTYGEHVNQWWQHPILGILRRFTTAFDPILLFFSLLGFVFNKQNKKIYLWGGAVYLFSLIRNMGLLGARSIIIFTLIDIIILLLIFGSYIPSKLRKRFFITGIIVSFFFITFFVSMTIARFSDVSAKASNVNESLTFSMLLYSGESGINFMGSMYEKESYLLWGYDMFPLFRRILDLEYIGSDRQYATVYFQKATNARAFIFYQLIGSLYSNFGKNGTILIVLFLNIFLSSRFKYKNSINLSAILCIFFLASIVGKGIFYYIPKTEQGNLTYILLIVIPIALKKLPKPASIVFFRKRH